MRRVCMANFLKSPRFLKKIKLGSSILGLILLVYLIVKLGPAEILSHLQKVGFGFFYIFLLSLITISTVVWGWQLTIKSPQKKVSFWYLCKVKLIGETVNTLTPLGWGGGDTVRVLMINKKLLPAQGTASVLVDRVLQNLSVALFMLIGVFLSFKELKLPLFLEIALSASLALLLLVCAFLHVHSHRGFLGFFITLLQKTKIKKNFSEETLKHTAEINGYISEFYKNQKARFLLALGLQFLCRLLNAFEIYLVAIFIGHPLSLTQSYLLGSMTVIINTIFLFVPGTLGVLEGAFAGTFSLFNLDPTVGSSIQLVRRIRMLLWNFIGLALSIDFRKKNPIETNPVLSGSLSLPNSNFLAEDKR